MFLGVHYADCIKWKWVVRRMLQSLCSLRIKSSRVPEGVSCYGEYIYIYIYIYISVFPNFSSIKEILEIIFISRETHTYGKVYMADAFESEIQ